MKVSLAWLWDHIDSDKSNIDVAKLVEQFNRTVAEIEEFQKVEHNPDLLSLAKVTKQSGNQTTVYSEELQKKIILPARAELQVGQLVLLYKKVNNYRWANVQDFGCLKDGYVAAVQCSEDLVAGGWKQHWEKTDYILDVDNKSINHRPDLWGHRGLAREIAAMLDLQLKPQSDFVAELSLGDSAFNIEVTTKGCNAFAGLYFEQLESTPSLLWMAHRLMRVGSRAHDALVDITNYVMLDTSQPLHAFDAEQLKDKTVLVRNAKAKEKLTLLDDQAVELTQDDIVVTDGKKPVALAGIMGGKKSGINSNTKSVFLESANFDPTYIRKTAARIKIRTEASTRFEKTLDPHQNLFGIKRFVKLLEDAKVVFAVSGNINSISSEISRKVIEVQHSRIEQLIGVLIDSEFVMRTLIKLEFDVVKKNDSYSVKVPTFRATKDIAIEQDIIEEVVRFFGFANIKPELPAKVPTLHNTFAIGQTRAIKRYFAYACNMRELYSYAFYDESFLKELDWQPKETLQVQDPVSENYKRLVTSLFPNLFKAVKQNNTQQNQLRFFEFGRTWQPGKPFVEMQQITGICWNKKDIDFYDAKNDLLGLFDLLKLQVTWEQEANPTKPWFTPYKTARIMHNNNCVGMLGVMNSDMLHKVTEGQAALFWLDTKFVTNYKVPKIQFVPASKYPASERDISMLVPLAVTVAQLEKTIAAADNRIANVQMVDLFQKKEWKDKKSVALRFILQDATKTLTKEEVDTVMQQITKTLQTQHGAEVR